MGLLLGLLLSKGLVNLCELLLWGVLPLGNYSGVLLCFGLKPLELCLFGHNV